MPVTQLNNVVLPAPLGPITDVMDRSSMVKETSSRAARPPKRMPSDSMVKRAPTLAVSAVIGVPR